MSLRNMPQRILIIRLSALGDVIHGLPVAAALRAAFPDAHLGWLVEDRCSMLIEGNPLLDRVHVIPRQVMKRDLKRKPVQTLTGPMREVVRELRAERYDISIDLQGLTKSALWGWLAKAPRRIGFEGEDAREKSAWFYTEQVLPGPECVHVVQKTLSLLGPLGIRNPDIRFPFRLEPGAEERGRRLWAKDGDAERASNEGGPNVILNVGAGWPTKRWPPAYFGELAARLVENFDACVAVAWGPGEEGFAEEALAAAGRAGLAEDRIGREQRIESRSGVFLMPPTSILEFGGAIAASQLYVGGDTGPTHMAAALGIPVVSPFGASPLRRNGPLGDRVEAIQLDSPECIPCFETECRWQEPLACLTRLSVGRIYDACVRLLGESS